MKSFILIISAVLLLILAGCKEDPHSHGEDHFEAIGVVIYSGDSVVASILRGVTSDTLKVTSNTNTPDYSVRFYNPQEQIVAGPTESEIRLSWNVDHSDIVEVEGHASHGQKYLIYLKGKNAGTTNVEFLLLHGDHADFRSGKIPVRVN
jgi:hypothetical protein